MTNSDDTKNMLRAIINGQSNFRQEVLGKIDKLDKKVEQIGEKLDNKLDGVEKRLTERIDKIGKQLAYLEDDIPTKQEFDKLEKKVDKIKQRTGPLL